MKVKRTNIVIEPDRKRVLLRDFEIGNQERRIKIINRILALSEERIKEELAKVKKDFQDRHKKVPQFFLQRFEEVKEDSTTDVGLSDERKMLIGAYFSHEYSIESAALFNPSMIWHPDQSHLPEGSKRFIVSLRATGEGHISSITFRSGVVDKHCNIKLDEPEKYVTSSKIISIQAQSNYKIVFSENVSLSERVIFPSMPAEVNGIEDVRFVEFTNDDGTIVYYGLYTAFDGKAITPQLIKTTDFLHFEISRLSGTAVQNKGMALFPKKINNKYAMISRQDGENIYIMSSDKIHSWNDKTMLLEPAYQWEFIQLGNCGSPIETEEGWLLLTHGVGAMRKYTMGAVLLDLDNPSKIIGRIIEPILSPDENEREGYVPNVVYSCGGQIHNGELIIPYAMSDYASSFATINVNELIAELKSNYAD